MLIYILKFSACLLIFLGFYKLVLEKESIHSFKRYYLLGAILLALIIPQITFTTYVEPIRLSTTLMQETSSGGLQFNSGSRWIYVNPVNHWPTILYTIYFLGVFLSAFKFLRNLYKITTRIRRNPKIKESRLTKVLLWGEVIPHTFLSYIFYNRKKFQNGEIPQEVIWHEEVHAKQWHSIDVLIVELFQIVLWFNPLIRLTKNCIKLNHEFLADQGVLKKGVKPGLYQQIVLAFAINKLPSDLVNAFQFSFIKKRFTIMKTKTTKKAMVLRSLLFLPLLSLTLFSFSSRRTEVKSLEEKPVLDAMEEVLPVIQDEVINTVDEYNKLAKYYGEYPPYDFVTKAKDMWKMRHLYERMSTEERAGAEPYPKSTTSLTISITNDGTYLRDFETEMSLLDMEVLFKQLTKEELSNAFVFSGKKSISNYVKERRHLNLSDFPPNDIYVSIFSNTRIDSDHFFGKLKDGEKFRQVNYAIENEKLKQYVDQLHAMFKKYGIKVYGD